MNEKIYSKKMSVAELIDALMGCPDKTAHIELCDVEGDRYFPMGVDVITDGEDNHVRNADINFSTEGYNKSPEFLNNMDWGLLRDQKELLTSLNISQPKVMQDVLDGIINTIDAMQDYAVEYMEKTEEEIFNLDN